MTNIDPALRTTRTTCPYCGVGCGVLATPDGRGGAAISGDPDHPANFGRLCSKGSALGETLGLTNRLLYPMIRCDKGNMERVAWSDALDHVAHRFQHIIARDGPGAVAFYLSGQLLTEDYYVANKLMKGFLGSANVDTNSRLCMASSVAGHRRAFGSGTGPAATKTSTRRTSWCLWGRTRPGAIRCSISEWCGHAGSAVRGSSPSKSAALRRPKAPVSR